MMNSLEIVSSTAEPGFAVDTQGTILAWNPAAEKLFGYPQGTVLQRPCWEVLTGRDASGNDYCGPACPLIAMALQHKAIRRCDLVFRDAAGEPTPARVSTLTAPGRDSPEPMIIHLLCPLAAVPDSRADSAHLRENNGCAPLTPRELEVLRLLADGADTAQMARELGLSPSTVRNHLDHVFRKLKVHSRVQALARAHRFGLIC